MGAYGDDDNGNYSGSAYVFVRSNGVWTEQGKLTAGDGASSDSFGISVSVSGDTALVGAHGDDDNGSASGSAYVFVRSNGVWAQQGKLTAGDGAPSDVFGRSVSVSNDTALVGAVGDDDNGSASGSAYVFVRSNGVWTQQGKLTAGDGAPSDSFGWSVSLSGDTALVGAYGDDDNGNYSGSAYVFVRSNGVWTQQGKLTASDGGDGGGTGFFSFGGLFGRSVSVSGDTALVGADGDDDNGSASGSAYVFVRSNGVWTEQDKLTAGDGASSDSFGWSVSLSGDTALVGANGDDDSGSSSGSAYFYDLGVPPVNDPPVSTADTATTNEDEAVVMDVLANDSDPNPGDTLSIASIADETNGSAVINPDNTITFTPDIDFNGVAGFTYVAQDNNGALSGSAAVTITVDPVADVSLSVMHPQDGMTVENVRPALMAPFTADFDIRETNFRVYLNDIEYSADVMIEGDKAAFIPFFDLPEGNNTYRIDIVLADGTVLASETTTFTINSVLPNPTDTQFSGQVQSLEGTPIEGVVIYSGVQTATTDANGQFSFTDLPYGNNLFEFDPSAAADGKLYTPVNLSFEVRPGRKTVWERPVYLAEYDPADGVNVVSNSPTDQVVENPNLPGVKVIIPAGTEISFPDGSTSGVVTIVDIPVALSPNCLGAGLRPSRLISLQPENTRLSQPAQLVFPNDLGFARRYTF